MAKRPFPAGPAWDLSPRTPLLFPWRTVLANVRLPLEIKAGGKKRLEELNEKAREALRLANLEGAEEKYPHQLSRGMKQGRRWPEGW